MSAAEVQQVELDLGDYRGQKIKATKVKLANANDGFDPSTSLESPRIYEIGETLTLAVEVIVIAHQAKAGNPLEDEMEMVLLQTFKCGTMAVIPRKSVAKELNAAAAAETARKAAIKAAAAAKKKAPVRRGNLAAVQTDAEPKRVGDSLEAALGQ